MLRLSTDGSLDKLEIHDPVRRHECQHRENRSVNSNVVPFPPTDFPFTSDDAELGEV